MTEPLHTPRPTAKRVPRHKMVRRIGTSLLLLLLIVIGLLLYVVQFESGTASLWKTASWLSQGSLKGQYVSGRLRDGIRLRDVVYKDSTTLVTINQIDSRWSVSLSPRLLAVDYLHVGDVAVTTQSGPPTESSGLPDNLRIPLSVHLNDIAVNSITLHQNDSDIVLNNLALAGSSDGQHHALTLKSLSTPYGELTSALTLDGQRPFALAGNIDLQGTFKEEKYAIATQLSGSLEDIAMQIQASGDKLNGTANIDATPFSAVPLKRAVIRIAHLNPRTFGADLPEADISVDANLLPVKTTNTVTSVQDAPLTVQGTIAIRNDLPGPLDLQRIPLIQATAQVQLNAEKQTVSDLDIHLLQKARITGGGQFNATATPDQPVGGNFQVNVSQLDLHALHNQLKPSQLQGPVQVAITPDAQTITLSLKDKVYDVQLKTVITGEEIQLETVRLAANKAVLNVNGTISTIEKMPFAIKGTLRNFDPALWIEGGKKALPSSMNMDIDVSGAMQPQQQIDVAFNVLSPSTYAKLPMSGTGKLHILDSQLRPSKAVLHIAGNDIKLDGSFGQPKDRLAVLVDAPHLDRLGFGLSGLLKLDAVISGAITTPKIQANYQAQAVRIGNYQLASLVGKTHIDVDLDKGLASAANKLDADIKMEGLQSPAINLARLNVQLAGTSASHQLRVNADGKLGGKALSFALAAQGKIFAQGKDYGWDGVINTLENKTALNSLPRITLSSPLKIRAAPNNITVGAAKLLLADAVIDLKNFHLQDGRIQSQGAITSLNIATLQEIAREVAGVHMPIRTDLILDSEWNFSLGDRASGFAKIVRRSGDLSVASGKSYIALDLSELQLRADFKDQQLQVQASTISQKIGSFAARISSTLVKDNGLLSITPASRVAGNAQLTIPDLARVGGFIGPQVSLKGALNSNLKVEGTIEKPQVSGAVNGDALSLTLLDQGIQLQDGTIRLTLNRNILELQKFDFYGGKGSVKMQGKVKLDESNPDMQARIIADRLELFASPDRQLMLSGQATLTNIDEKLHLDGKFVVDKALIDLPKSSAPTLGSDVVILDPNQRESDLASSDQPAGNLTPIVSIDIDMGNDFRFVGSGADLIISGGMQIKREPSSNLRSTGTVEARGTYEAFGVKLNIERGLINFQGPINNPTLNILAMRRNQEIEAGVEVTGNANQPRIRLVSEPNVSDEEKLSWLMFSQGSDSSSMSEAQATNQALAFLGNYGGKKIAQEFGIDQFSIGASESGLSSEQVVNIGKAISKKIMFGVEKALTGPDSVAKLTWVMSRRWSLVARGGTINGINVLFNLRFD